MYRIVFVLTLCFATCAVFAQPGDLAIQGASPDLYLLHVVAPKENWYSVGRLYNISPKEIAPQNGISMDKPLGIGQQLKIPLTSGNFSQDGSKAPDEVFVPIYHTVQDKEWMFRISTNYNKVPVETLEQWNHVSKDQAKAGMKLIVGYLKVKTGQSPLAAGSTNVAPVKTIATETAIPPATRPEEKKPVPTPAAETGIVKTTPTPIENKTPPVSKPVGTPSGIPRTTPDGEGYFKTIYENGGRRASGTAGIFKSRSGWDDGKYYALMNDMPIGTVVKITNPSTSKTVYAKVLGQLPDMKESAGLALRISDAAASVLGAADTKFSVSVN